MTERTWIGGIGGDWLDQDNWTPTGIPAAGDTLTVLTGAPSIATGTIAGEKIILNASVTLNLTSVTFEPSPGAMLLFVGGGDHDNPTLAEIHSAGTSAFTGTLLVNALGGGGLTLTAASDGSTANFIFTDDASLVVSQESRLTLAGDTIVNDGTVQVEGLAVIDAGTTLGGSGMIELDKGGQLFVNGIVEDEQRVVFADGTGFLAIDDGSTFLGTIGVTWYGGDRIDLDGVKARSASFDDGVLKLYAGQHHRGAVTAALSFEQVNPADLDALESQTLTRKDFAIRGDGHGGTLVTYAPSGPTYLEASLPVPVVADLNAIVSLEDLFTSAFGTAHPDFYGITLLPAKKLDTPEAYWGQASNGIDGVLSGWLVNGAPVTAPRTVVAGDVVTFLVGNNIGFPPELEVQLTPESEGKRAVFLDYYLWTVAPEVATAIGATPGKPTAEDIVNSAAAYQNYYGTVLNTDLCNWIADNVAAATGATMPLPDQMLAPELNQIGGFWRIAYRGSDPGAVPDWNTKVEPGDIVRLEWAAGSGHTTTVLAVNQDGSINVYDNINVVGGQHTIGAHDDVAYWTKTDPAGITIYRLDPDSQYLIPGTERSEFLQGSVFDDLIKGRAGGDRLSGSIGNDELQGGRGRDILRGEAGNDTIFGGTGADRLSGGEGDNLFVYTAASQSRPGAAHRDLITHFEHGADHIDLSAINDALKARGERPLHFGGEGGLSHGQSELAYTRHDDYVVVEADTNGDGLADFAIRMNDVSKLFAGDFIL